MQQMGDTQKKIDERLLGAGHSADEGEYRDLGNDPAEGQSPEVLRSLAHGRELFAAGNWRGAADAVKHAARLSPNDPGVRCALASVYYGIGEIQLGLAASQKLIELAPTWPVGWFQRAVGYSRRGRYDEAIQDYTEAIRLAPTAGRSFTSNMSICSDAISLDSAARISRSECRMRLGDQEGALNDINAVVRDNPLWPTGFGLRARLHRGMHDFERAWADCTTALTLDPHCAQALATRGCIHAHFERDLEAIADFSRSIALTPAEVFAYANRGLAYARLKQFDRAIEDYSEAIRLSPRYAKVFEARGCAYYRRGEWRNAIEDFTRALEIKPGLKHAHDYRAFALEAIGDYAAAAEDRLMADGLAAPEGP